MPHSRPARLVARAAALGVVLVGLAAAVAPPTPAADAVILTDGFVLSGRALKESSSGGNYGFDVVEDGPKVTVYSTHTKKGGKVEKDVTRPEFVAYKREWPGSRAVRPPAIGELKGGDFNEKWRRILEVKSPDGTHKIEQMVTFLDPNSCWVASTSHAMRVAYHTAEMDIKQVRLLLENHPDLVDKNPRKPDPLKRLAIATFLKDTGWLTAAKQELDRAHKDIPWAWEKDAIEREDKFKAELEAAENKLVIDELEAAAGSGRYEAAKAILAAYNPKTADPKDTTRLAVVKAQVETVLPRYELTRRLLRDILDRGTLGDAADAQASLAGGAALTAAPRAKPAEPLATLLAAGETIYAELHPDSVARIELFTTLAQQEEKRRAAGRPAENKPAELLALAVTGWLRGKSGAETLPASAVKYWAARQMAFAYFGEEVANTRRGILAEFLKSGNTLPPDELAQIIATLPPTAPEDLSKPLGLKVPKADAGYDGVWKRNTTGDPEARNGVDYLLRLPPEYHHGRSYPVVIALTHPSIPPEKMVGSLAADADRNGYIVAAPIWTGQFDAGYDYSAKQHRFVTLVLRDLFRRFQVDADRVFLYGFGDGATFAFDLGLSHPDLFAGVVAFGPSARAETVMHNWRNAQKLPFFVVTGEYSGPSLSAMRKTYQNWVTRGFPSILTIYRGRGVEWYGMEVPRAFDWMSRKVRTRGTGSLRLNAPLFETWQVTRETEDRFYWVGTTSVRPGFAFEKLPKSGVYIPATIQADIRTGNLVAVQATGLKNVVIWLERDMIDWTNPVTFQVNGAPQKGFANKKLEPDLNLMFEEIYRTGDRKMLFLGKFTFDLQF